MEILSDRAENDAVEIAKVSRSFYSPPYVQVIDFIDTAGGAVAAPFENFSGLAMS